MARYASPFEAFAAGLGGGLGEGVPGALAYDRQRKDKAASEKEQRDYLAQQKQNAMDFADQESRNKMAEFLLSQTHAPAGDVMQALPVAADPGKMDQLRSYLGQMQPGRNASLDASTPSPFPGMSRFDATVKAKNIGNTMQMTRERFNPNAGAKGGGKPKTFADYLKTAISARNATIPLDQLRPFTREEVKTMGMNMAASMGRPLTAQEGQILERYIGTTGQ